MTFVNLQQIKNQVKKFLFILQIQGENQQNVLIIDLYLGF